MIREKIDQLIEYMTQNFDSDYIFQAKQVYQNVSGEIYVDDKSYESRIGLFLEWFIFDRLIPEKNVSLIESITTGNTPWALNDLIIFKEFTKSIHSLFLVKKIRDDGVIIQDLFSNIKYEVNEPQSKMMFQTKDIFEGRLLPYEEELYFSGNFCFHPREVSKYILQVSKEILTAYEIFAKEEGKIDTLIENLQSEIKKQDQKIDKLRDQIEKAGSEKKRLSLQEKKSAVHNEKQDSKEILITLQFKKKHNTEQSDKTQCDILALTLMQKLSYMNLKWERSRQIDPIDIYSN
jgi:hypothetical protein